MKPVALLIVTVGVLVTAGAARAQSSVDPAVRDQARAQSDLGKRHYELGDYEAAIAAYRGAYLLLPSAGVLFNLGQAYRMNGDCAAAAGAYRSFLRSEPVGPARQLADEQLPVVERCARTSSKHNSKLRTAGLVTSVVGVAALGAATYFALDARRAEHEVEEFSHQGGSWDAIADVDARGHRSSTLGIGFAIAGGATLATGVVLYAIGHRNASSERANLYVTPSRTAAVAGASWSF